MTTRRPAQIRVALADKLWRLAAGALAAAMALIACANQAPHNTPESALLRQAIDAAGGEAALSRARILEWSGEATIFAAERTIEIGVETRVEPFHAARSDTWLLAQGPSSRRSLEIADGSGWMTRAGKREPMPAEMLRHERAQYAVYGLMRLVSLRDSGTVLRMLPRDREGRQGLHVEHAQAPPADLYFNDDGRLASLLDRVPAADGNGEVAQRFDFDGTLSAGGIRWPQSIRIAQSGKPYFELRIRTFASAP